MTERPGAAPHDEAVFGGSSEQILNDVVWTGSRFVGVGLDRSGGDMDAAVWVSDDGEAWTRVPHDEGVFGGAGDQWMKEVAHGPSGLVAAGITPGAASADLQDPAVWYSPDGMNWKRLTLFEPTPEAALQYVIDVTVDLPGLPYLGALVGWDRANPTWCGTWALVGDAIVPNSDFLGLCGPQGEGRRIPRTIDAFDGLRYAFVEIQPPDSPSQFALLASSPDGPWGAVMEFPYYPTGVPMDVHRIDGTLAVIGVEAQYPNPDETGIGSWV
jgi:hypothetical protein